MFTVFLWILNSKLFWKIPTKTMTSFAAASFPSRRRERGEVSAMEKDVSTLVRIIFPFKCCKIWSTENHFLIFKPRKILLCIITTSTSLKKLKNYFMEQIACIYLITPFIRQPLEKNVFVFHQRKYDFTHKNVKAN